MSFGEPAELRTRMMRVEGGELDMGKLAQVDQLADAVADRKVSAADGVDQLAAIIAAAAAAVLAVAIGLVLASAFSAIVVYAQELMPGRVGFVAGLFFGFAFGIAGIGAKKLERYGAMLLEVLRA